MDNQRVHYLTDLGDLRGLYDSPSERAIRKELRALDHHCRRFIELSPFVVMATGDGEHYDASPRGGEPGFVQSIDDVTLWIPDSRGNNRLDSMANILATGRIGLLFLVPGVDETLRVNGSARISSDPDKTARFTEGTWTPRVVVEVSVEEAFLQCAKALMRSKLWSRELPADRAGLPTIGEMISDQTGLAKPPESQAEMVARYKRDL